MGTVQVHEITQDNAKELPDNIKIGVITLGVLGCVQSCPIQDITAQILGLLQAAATIFTASLKPTSWEEIPQLKAQLATYLDHTIDEFANVAKAHIHAKAPTHNAPPSKQ